MTPEHEAFEVLHAFTISAFEDLSEPLVFSFAGADGVFQLRDSKDWKEGLLKHFNGKEVNLTIVGDNDDDSDSDSDSFCLVTKKGDIVSTDKPDKLKKDASEPKKIEEPKVVNNDEGVIEDYNDDDDKKSDDDKKLEDKKADDKQSDNKKPEESLEGSRPNHCRNIKARIIQFIADVGCEALQNIVGVTHSLLKEGAELADAIRTSLETSDVAANHPLVKDFLPVLDVYVDKFQQWVPMLTAFNIDNILALIPNLVECVSQAAEGRTDVELDIAPIFSQICPHLVEKIRSAIPNGQERVWQVDAFNPFEAIDSARKDVSKEFGKNISIHKGITCDLCDACPIIGVRYKSVLRPDFDLCEDCEKKHDPNDPLIKMKKPIQNLELLPGLHEFVRQCGRRRGCPGFRGRGFRRGRGRGRGHCGRGHRGRGHGGRWKKMWTELAKQQRENCNANDDNDASQNDSSNVRNCVPLGHPFRAMFDICADFVDPVNQQQQNNVPQVIEVDAAKRDPAKVPMKVVNLQTNEPAKVRFAEKDDKIAEKKTEIADKKAEVAEKKRQIRALKKEAKRCRRDLKKIKKEQKKEKQQLKKFLKGEVVGHLDNEEKSVQLAGSVMMKTWKVQNSGDIAWPAETVAVFKKGNQSMVQDVELSIGAVEANEVAYVRCILKVPELKGSYLVCYNMQAPEIGSFGPPLICRVDVIQDLEVDSDDDSSDDTMDSAIRDSARTIDTAIRDSAANSPDVDIIDIDNLDDIKVVKDDRGNNIVDLSQYDNPLDVINRLHKINDSSKPKASAPPANDDQTQYGKELKQLKQMGFKSDDETLHSVLVACNGDVGQAIQLLM